MTNPMKALPGLARACWSQSKNSSKKACDKTQNTICLMLWVMMPDKNPDDWVNSNIQIQTN